MGDLILVDGYTLTVNGGIKVANNHSLTIYGQSGRTGKLTATTEKTDGRYAGIGGDMNSKFGSGPVFPCFVWRPQATSGHSLFFADRGRGAGRLPHARRWCWSLVLLHHTVRFCQSFSEIF